ncbi:hypothetical protein [Streptomyces sp. NPDC013181]|uniref:hypothetical protein n=1 Tax=unclassified Streptomyces TaxID=2593676 RepID=UPI00367E7459
MNPEAHLALYRAHSPELRIHLENVRAARRAARRRKLRSRLGWAMVEMGLRVLPAGAVGPVRAARTA